MASPIRSLARFVLAAGLLIVAGAAAAQPAPRRLEVPYTQFTLPNGLHVILHEDHSVPVVTRERLVPRRLGAREAGTHRVRAPLRAPDVHGLGPREARASSTSCSRPPAATTTARRQTTARTTASTCPSNALELALFLESDRMGYLLDAMTPSTRRRAARRREERAAPERREPAVRHGRTSRSARCSIPPDHPYHWPVIGYMEDLTAASYDDVVAVLQEVLRARRTRAWWSRATSIRRSHARAGREVVQRREAGGARVEPITIPGVALDRRAEEDDRRIACSCRASTSRG